MTTTARGRMAAMRVAPAILAAAALLTTGCGGSGGGDTAQSRLLSAADLPAGWSATPVSQKAVQTSSPCLSGLGANHQGYTYASAAFAGEEAPATIRPISFPTVGGGSTAYAWTFTVSGIPVGDDLILFRAGSYEGYLTYADVGSPSPATVQAFANAAVAKAEHGSTSPVPGTVSITSAPLIPGAKLTVFPEAGHAFLFRDQAAFVPQIESFPG